MVIQVRELKDDDVLPELGSTDVTIRLVEKDGSFIGAKTDIKIPAGSYELLEEIIVERWLAKNTT